MQTFEKEVQILGILHEGVAGGGGGGMERGKQIIRKSQFLRPNLGSTQFLFKTA